MAPSELAEIRALLIAQTETVEERRPPSLLGIVGSLLKPRGESLPPRPLTLSVLPTPAKAPAPPERRDDDDVCLLLGGEIDAEMFAPLEPPAPPRAEFGVRSPRPYLPHDSVLLLNKRAAAEPRRLTLLTDTGEAVGEIYLTPEEAPARQVYNAAHLGEEHQAPYFPGDLEEIELLVPAITKTAQIAGRSMIEPAPVELAPPRAKRVAAAFPDRPGLGHDLLQALALTLAREHEALCDRLMAWTQGT